jgi:hypothetical protein
MPGPVARMGHGVDYDGEHACCVRVPARNGCGWPTRSPRAGVHSFVRFVSSPPAFIPHAALRGTLVACADATLQWPEAVRVHDQTAVVGYEGCGARSTSRLNRPLWSRHSITVVD